MLKELLIFIKDFITAINKEISENGGKAVIYSIFILIGGILFFSPGYVLIFFYKVNTLSNNCIAVNLINTLIIDSILFIIIFISGIIRGVKIPKESKGYIEYKESSLIDIVITMMLMSIISFVLIVTYILLSFNKYNYTVRIGIITLISTTGIVIFMYICKWIKIYYMFISGKIRYNSAVKKYDKANQINNDLMDDDNDNI